MSKVKKIYKGDKKCTTEWIYKRRKCELFVMDERLANHVGMKLYVDGDLNALMFDSQWKKQSMEALDMEQKI